MDPQPTPPRGQGAPITLSPYGGSPILNIITEKQLRTCVHCGLCLSYCPTYRANSLEADSPRGRIFQIRELAAGTVAPDDPDLRQHLDLCLGCRACETACPSGVPYGALIEAARAQLPPRTTAERVTRRATLGFLFMHPWAMRAAGLGLRLYQRSGLRALVQRSGLLRLLPGGLAAQEALLPVAQGGLRKRPLPVRRKEGAPPRYRVALLTGCIQDELFRGVNVATARVLARNGCAVGVPPQVHCCGALHSHIGERTAAQQLARTNIAAFEATGADYYIVNASGCGAQLKQYDHLLHDDPAYAARAARFVARVRDFAELLVEIGFQPPAGALPLRVTYQDACHLKHGQKIAAQPRALLRAIPGLTLVEMQDSDTCCGSAGIYNITQPAMSATVLSWKTEHIGNTHADLVVASNPGCAIQIAHGLRQAGRPLEVLHLAELLERAYQAAPPAAV
ncbi:MAG TPA: (Fe-S)-binding protein [Chloroflexia bacterium]|nr:(Fe-S)-binding protein [Chloroflexia bacterium]